MKYKEKIERMTKHVADHPNDYQSKISLLQLNSREIDYQRHKKHVEMVRKIEKYKKELGEKKHEQKQ